MDGILNIYKEAGFTSHDVVAKLRGICRQKKIGHTGTLDPMATGVLPVCLGKATKVCDFLTNQTKRYQATVLLGITTDTQDVSGQILHKRPVAVSEEKLRQVICRFTGETEQIPPMYSAVKIQGKKLYELARKGVEVERKARKITIYSIRGILMEPACNEFQMTVHCSKGTYIRTLCHDIGEMLGCGAAMKSLLRTQAGDFSIEHAVTLSEAERMAGQGTLEASLMKIEDVFAELKKGTAAENADKYLQNGNVLRKEQVVSDAPINHQERIRLYTSSGKFAAIYRYSGKKQEFRLEKMFL